MRQVRLPRPSAMDLAVGLPVMVQNPLAVLLEATKAAVEAMDPEQATLREEVEL
jgi:hypothetical protein